MNLFNWTWAVSAAALVASVSIGLAQAQYYNPPSFNQYLPQPRSTPPQYLPQQQYNAQQFNPPQQSNQPLAIGGYYTRNLGGGMSPC